jgi:hypothetical protein
VGFALVIIGLLMVITGGRGTYAQFGSQLASEFQGQNSFTYQMIGIGAVGALGYIPALQTISRFALAFVLLVILLGNKNSAGFYTAFTAALNAGPKAPLQPASTGNVSSTNPSGAPVINLGPLGTINTNPIVPGGTFYNFLQLFGTPVPGTTGQ